MIDVMGREHYLSVVTACDMLVVGPACGVAVPTFPAKTIEYLRAGLPVITSVEPTAGDGEFVIKRGFGDGTLIGDKNQMTAKRILIMCTKFETLCNNNYLTNDLANALAESGNRVQVVSLDWGTAPGSPPKSYRQENGIDVLIVSPVQISSMGQLVARGSKWVFSSICAMSIIRQHLNRREFDLFITFSPVVTCALPILWVMRRFRVHSYVHLWDFFPFYHAKGGLLPKGLVFDLARRAETTLIRQFDVVACMSPEGVNYLRKKYHLRPEQRTEVLYLWGPVSSVGNIDSSAERQFHKLPADRRIVIFGGQLCENRGIENILDTARLAKNLRPEVLFLMIGHGRLASLVEAYIAEGAGNLVLMDALPRDQYLSLAAACDVGLASTSADVEVPTFPTKVIDYLRARLPIVAAVEATTDFGDFISERGLGFAAPAGDAPRLLEAISRILDDPASADAMRVAGQKTLAEVFDVRMAAAAIIRQSFGVAGTSTGK